MKSLAALTEPTRQQAPRLELLIADDDDRLRSLIAARARETLGPLSILEAADGAEAVQLGLQHRPRIALLDVNMPRLGGIEVALTLRDLLPQLHVALHSAEPSAHRERAREHRLPLFDKLQLDKAMAWLELLAGTRTHVSPERRSLQKLALECSVCGYGIVRASPPERCVMCRSEGSWVHAPWRPFVRG